MFSTIIREHIFRDKFFFFRGPVTQINRSEIVILNLSSVINRMKFHPTNVCIIRIGVISYAIKSSNSSVLAGRA